MDDLISRQAAINAIHEDADWLAAQGSDWQVERMERDKSILKSLPPVQPKRETTTLKIGRTRNSVTMWYECEKCGEPVDQEDAFCRRCGRGIIHE